MLHLPISSKCHNDGAHRIPLNGHCKENLYLIWMNGWPLARVCWTFIWLQTELRYEYDYSYFEGLFSTSRRWHIEMAVLTRAGGHKFEARPLKGKTFKGSTHMHTKLKKNRYGLFWALSCSLHLIAFHPRGWLHLPIFSPNCRLISYVPSRILTFC